MGSSGAGRRSTICLGPTIAFFKSNAHLGIAFHLAEGRVPFTERSKGAGSPQFPVGIGIGENITQRRGVGGEQSGKRYTLGDGEDRIAGSFHLQCEKDIGFYGASVGHPYGGMIIPDIREYDVHGHGFCALRGQFLDDASVNLARPIEPKMESEREIGVNVIDTGFIDGNKAEIGGDRRLELVGFPDPHVIGHAFDRFQKVKLSQANGADEQDDSECN